ncbi:MAG: hypothetical protein QW692_00545 [Nitrososphaerota archaeon]
MIIDVADDVKVHVIKSPGDYRLMLIGDIHYGNAACRRNILRKALLFAEKNDFRIGLMGDLFELVTPKKREEGHIGQVADLDQQIEMFREDFYHFRHRVDFVIQGNHDRRIFMETGLDAFKHLVVDWIREENPNCITNEPKRGLLIVIEAGGIPYRCYFAHGSRKSKTPQYQLYKALARYELDLIALAHIHRDYDEPITRKTIVNKEGEWVTAIRRLWIARSGSFIGDTEYAEETLEPLPDIGAKTLIFHSDRYWIKGELNDFYDVEGEFPAGPKGEKITLQKRPNIAARITMHDVDEVLRLLKGASK